MDEPTPDLPPPSGSPPPRGVPARAADPEARPLRVQKLVGPEPVVASARGWVSRERGLHRLLAVRMLDTAVVTETRFLLVSTGFLTRRPRRLVFTLDLDQAAVVDVAVPRGRRLVVTSAEGDRIRIELSASDRSDAFAQALLERAAPGAR